ncbi:hypothetical protein chiPu_0026018, partial [Chiloscyllium punctatum]|nr:hypothetical protein [Chiloscyllium punctatum]
RDTNSQCGSASQLDASLVNDNAIPSPFASLKPIANHGGLTKAPPCEGTSNIDAHAEPSFCVKMMDTEKAAEDKDAGTNSFELIGNEDFEEFALEFDDYDLWESINSHLQGTEKSK